MKEIWLRALAVALQLIFTDSSVYMFNLIQGYIMYMLL